MSDIVTDTREHATQCAGSALDNGCADCGVAANALENAANEIERLRSALIDMLSGWKYIRANHGDLYGVGWDRAQSKAEKALGEKD